MDQMKIHKSKCPIRALLLNRFNYMLQPERDWKSTELSGNDILCTDHIYPIETRCSDIYTKFSASVDSVKVVYAMQPKYKQQSKIYHAITYYSYLIMCSW